MDNCYGQHGWKEFLRNRKDILNEFDKVLEQTKNRPIHVAHGQAVEAYIRKWLAEFIPKKYAVTSGYIIPNLYDDSGKSKIYHYDIIIYNCLEAPVLWTEGNEDNSEQGKYRAIPAKHVVAVYEVKSRLTKDNVADALNKLNQTKDFSNQLNQNYTCGAIFIDLKESDSNKESILKELHKGASVFGFSGGMVLRYEGDDTPTGIISLFNTDPNSEAESIHRKPLAKRIDDLKIYITEEGNLECAEPGGGAIFVATAENTWSVSKLYGVAYKEGSLSVYLSWSRSNFSKFCINLLSALEGLAYNDKNRPSFGMVFDKIERKNAIPQPARPKDGFPFLKVSSVVSVGNGKKFDINYEEKTIEFWVEVENQSKVEVTISDDFFRTNCVLLGEDKAIKPVKLIAKVKDDSGDFNFENLLREEGLEMQYRLVYYPTQGEREFFVIEKNVKISDSHIEFV
ncbi:MAG TPA: hypothetical protein DEG17_05030 [Cyanobacteria bacterium UBA11149]|nr:hypothetical protein [Cyanobacteria bacterium UBA11367]HBE59223.1 hypothetical protein [Cyanobacteria bacterium UBA11366]HBK66336.1 hypothetical protein [Cyanobacteria bacterium UBA11166]HBR76888.1 hypothetical protein [Cyanobacteria bacterium UBA11159]HBS69114.1 hypothetical protein [Cyanobacteria bacterium UBA11153]HBW88248.1 hypothetical protein [Cyanobacteria bacterium UBA11149]HCA94686.1 hypothetical protein [Cyanobacteria bacterium UBA9226]